MSILLLLIACAGRPTPTALEVSSPEPAATATLERRTITLDPEETRWDETTGIATFSPGSRVQSASYTTWLLDLRSVEAVLGGRPTAPVDVVVEITSTETSRYTPEDPNLPSPMGGFENITITGRVVALLVP